MQSTPHVSGSKPMQRHCFQSTVARTTPMCVPRAQPDSLPVPSRTLRLLRGSSILLRLRCASYCAKAHRPSNGWHQGATGRLIDNIRAMLMPPLCCTSSIPSKQRIPNAPLEPILSRYYAVAVHLYVSQSSSAYCMHPFVLVGHQFDCYR